MRRKRNVKSPPLSNKMFAAVPVVAIAAVGAYLYKTWYPYPTESLVTPKKEAPNKTIVNSKYVPRGSSSSGVMIPCGMSSFEFRQELEAALAVRRERIAKLMSRPAQ